MNKETMNNEESYIMCDSDIDKKRIDEIDLGELARSFRMLDRFMNLEDKGTAQNVNGDEELHDTATKSRLINFLMCNKRYYVERHLALRMMFDSILGAPQHLAKMERVLGFRLTEDENEARQ
jgi:hypothetical protein